MSFSIQSRGVYTPGQKVFRYKSRDLKTVTEFYPERGMISIHGEMPDRTEDFGRCTVKEFVERAMALLDEAKRLGRQACQSANSTQQTRRFRQDQSDRVRLVETMIAAAKCAKEQGDPFDPRVTAHHVNHNRPNIVAVGQARANTPDPHQWSTGMPPLPRAPENKPYRDLAGTQVVDASKLIVPGR